MTMRPHATAHVLGNAFADQLLDRFEGIEDHLQPSTFALERLRSDIETLLKTDRAAGEMLLGLYHCALQNPVTSRAHHTEAIRLAPEDSTIVMNYAHSLHRMGFYGEAEQQARQVLERRAGDPVVYDFLLMNSLVSLNLRAAREWLKKWKRLKSEAHEEESFVRQAIRLLNARKVSDQECGALSRLAVELLHEEGVYRILNTFTILEDEDSQWIAHSIPLAISARRIVELNATLARRIAAAYLKPAITDAVVVDFSCATDEQLHGIVA
jgi:tetratricopeptide (TPR) repeat protein